MFMNELAELLNRYAKGQFEVAHMRDQYLGRGDIKSIELLDAGEPTAIVTLSWMAFFDPSAEEWHLGNRHTFVIPLSSFSLFHGDRLFVHDGDEGLCFALPGDVMIAPDQVVDYEPPNTMTPSD